MGFVWRFDQRDPSKRARPVDRNNHWGRQILPLLRAYHERHGDLDVPQKFVVPPDASWPEQFHGKKLGRIILAIRQKGVYVMNRPEQEERKVACLLAFAPLPHPLSHPSTGDGLSTQAI